MKSVVIDEPGKARMREIAEPELESDYVLLGIKYIGLCGSDLTTYCGPSQYFNKVPGVRSTA